MEHETTEETMEEETITEEILTETAEGSTAEDIVTEPTQDRVWKTEETTEKKLVPWW